MKKEILTKLILGALMAASTASVAGCGSSGRPLYDATLITNQAKPVVTATPLTELELDQKSVLLKEEVVNAQGCKFSVANLENKKLKVPKVITTVDIECVEQVTETVEKLKAAALALEEYSKEVEKYLKKYSKTNALKELDTKVLKEKSKLSLKIANDARNEAKEMETR